MIVHSIIVHKPEYTYTSYSHYTQKQDPVQTQADLDKLVAECPFQKDMFIRYKSIGSINSLFQVLWVCDVVKDLTQLEYNHQGKPRLIQVMNLGGAIGSSWKRWDIPEGFCLLSDEEMAAYITNNAHVLHRVKVGN